VACKYIYKGHTFNSEIELDDFLLRKGHELYSEYGDLVFQSERAIAACEKLKIAENDAKLYREKYKEARRRYIDGEDELEFEKPFIGVTEFLRGLTNEDDKLLTPEFREEEYWKRRINEWKDETKGFNDDEIELFGKSVVMTDDVSDKELTDYLKQYNEGNKNTNNETLKLIRKMKEKWEAQGEIGTAVHDVLRNLFTTIKKGPHKGELFLDRDEDWLLN
jgi:hypothetical protein